MIKLLEPTFLEQALNLARCYEQNLNNQPKKYINGGGYEKLESRFLCQLKELFQEHELLVS